MDTHRLNQTLVCSLELIKKKVHGPRTLVWIYVDDSFWATTRPEERDRFRDMSSDMEL
jgi:hypothetical protein